jgi:hypothetical protein
MSQFCFMRTRDTAVELKGTGTPGDPIRITYNDPGDRDRLDVIVFLGQFAEFAEESTIPNLTFSAPAPRQYVNVRWIGVTRLP